MGKFRNYHNRKDVTLRTEFNPVTYDGRLRAMGKTPAVAVNVVPTVNDRDVGLENLTEVGKSKVRTYDAATSQDTTYETPTDTPVKSRFHVGGYFHGILDGRIPACNDVYGEATPMKEAKRPVTISMPNPTKMIVPYTRV